MRLLAQLGWRIANQPQMPKYTEGGSACSSESRAGLQSARCAIDCVTVDEIKAARERIRPAAVYTAH